MQKMKFDFAVYTHIRVQVESTLRYDTTVQEPNKIHQESQHYVI